MSWFASEAEFMRHIVDGVRNQSLWALARTWGLGNAGGAVARAALVALALSAEPRRRRLVLLAAIPLLSGNGWPQLFILAVPLLAEALAAGGAPARIAGAASAAVSLSSYDVAGPPVEAWVFAHRVDAVLLTVAVVAARFAREPSARAE